MKIEIRDGEKVVKWKSLKKLLLTVGLAVIITAALTGCSIDAGNGATDKDSAATALSEAYTEESAPDAEELARQLPEYSGETKIWINDDHPFFSKEDIKAESFEYYSPLDGEGRCGAAIACIGKDLMPTEERGSIGMVKPTGWHTVRYDNVEGGYLYNRCHLIGYQLSGENANENNLITGTRWFNVQGMLPYEELVADYVKKTGNHVLYRVTPVFEGDNSLATGVEMEAMSVEDGGRGVEFNVFVYNEQPGIAINHKTGDSREAKDGTEAVTNKDGVKGIPEKCTYVGNRNTGKFHRKTCSSVSQMAEDNRYYYCGDRQGIIDEGYSPCGACNP